MPNLLPPLPIDDTLPELLAALRQGNSVVLQAPTGAGKTTRVAPAILSAGLASGKRILLLEPRRLAARAAAARMAEERGCELGTEIGYQVRFERRSTRATQILVLTDGILLRMLQDDPLLEDIGCVVFDEFHERSLNLDLALALVRRVQAEVRPDLKLVVMSATLAAAPVAEYLGGCPVVTSAGRTFPVAIEFLAQPRSQPMPVAAARAAENMLYSTAGDVLVFLPGLVEIRRAGRELQSYCERIDCDIVELYGDLPLERQRAALEQGPRRRVVLATNVAETSVTVAGVTGVVDSGLANVLRFDPQTGMNQLASERISQASAEQRSGRAGRTSPGVCLRLWTQPDHAAREAQSPPEILRVELSGALLELLCWGETNVATFPWFEAPPESAVQAGLQLLTLLGAVHAGAVTEIGRQMVRLPIAPRLARMLVAGNLLGHPQSVALAAALLSERDPFRSAQAAHGLRKAAQWSDSDVLDRLAVIEEFDEQGGRTSHTGLFEHGSARFVLRARDQLLRLVEQSAANTSTGQCSADEAVRRALLAAMPDRVARRREAGGSKGLMVGGKGVRLAEESAVTQAELFVCVSLAEANGADALVRLASAIERDWLEPEQLSVTVELEFDARREKVAALRRTRLQDLILEEVSVALPTDERVAELLAAEAAARLDPASLLTDEDRQWLARVAFLREAMPELNLPVLDPAQLGELLPRLCQGCQSFADLRRAPLRQIWSGQLTAEQYVALDRQAPERIEVPSGSRIALVYEPGRPPILPVRIQELYGLKQTPRVAGGRVPVLLHLLGPNYRPQQITDDLASFWANTYLQVRKDLKRRYPKHSWPDDPANAAAEHRPRRKGAGGGS